MKTYIQKLKAALKARNEPHCNYIVELDCTISELLNSQCNCYDIPPKFKFNGFLCHLLEFINDSNEPLVVFKWFNKPKKRWEYSVEPVYILSGGIK